MATLSSPGVGSGLDIAGIVSKLMALESQPLIRLQTREAGFQAKLSGFGALKGALSALQATAKTLATPSTFAGMLASSSDSSVLSVSASSTALAGSYEISVSKLAKAHVVRTNVDYGSDTFDSGVLRVAIGSGTPTDITLSGTLGLGGIRDAINGADAGVKASIVNDGTADRLLLTSLTTGSAGAVTISAPTSNGDGDRPLTDLIGGNLTAVQPAQDAEFTVDGLAITRSSNTISDVIDGITLKLLKADASTPVTSTVAVSRNTAAVSSAVSGFVKAYNDSMAQIKSLTAYDSTNKRASILTGDSTVRSIQSQLAGLVSTAVSGVEGGISRLSDVGIRVQTDGSLAVDNGTLGTVLADNIDAVAAVFSQTTDDNEGIAVRFGSALDGIVGSTGLIASRTAGITASITDLQHQADAFNLRLTAIEKRYRSQFTALDTLVASMNQTSAYLTQQLASLSSLNSSK